MTDSEILQYLKKNNYKVDAQECVAKVFNTSLQILDAIYDSKDRKMTILTPENKFVFTWVLGRVEDE